MAPTTALVERRLTGGMDSGGGTGGSSGSAGSAGADAGPLVRVQGDDVTAHFHTRAGQLLHQGRAPVAYPLPADGAVTLQTR